MFQFVQQLLGSKSASSKRPRRTTRRRLGAESLEDRSMLSVVGAEIHANTTTFNSQFLSDTASNPAAGGYKVTAWTHAHSPTDLDIRAQIFDGFGNKVGQEFMVAGTSRMEADPSVAMDAQGNFVIAWADEVTSGNADIKARRYSSSGAPLGNAFTVAGGPSVQNEPSVAMAENGRFAVSYTNEYSLTDRDVHVVRYNSNGAFLSKVFPGYSGRNEHDSSLAMAADGSLAVAYQEDVPLSGGGENSNISLARYDANGGLLSNFYVAAAANNETNPDIGMDSDGNAVVVYQYQYSTFDTDLKAVKVSRFGVIGSTINVATSSISEFNPSVALDRSPGDGDFVVAYQTTDNGIGASRVMVREMNSSGSIRATYDLGSQGAFATPSISINGTDQWFVSYESRSDRPDDPRGGIYARRGYLS